MKYVAFSLLILFSLWAKTSHAQALNVVTEHWPPFNYQLANKEIGGIATEKVTRVLKEANIDFTLNLYPWARSYHMALSQPNTLIYSIYRNKQREHLFHWACPLLPRQDLYLFTLSKNKSIQKVDTKNLKQFKIGIVRQEIASIHLKAQGLKEGKELYVSASDDNNLKLLLEGKVDLIIGTIPSMKMRLENLNKAFSVLTAIDFPEINQDSEHCMAFSLNTPIYLVDKVRSALKKLNQADDHKSKLKAISH